MLPPCTYLSTDLQILELNFDSRKLAMFAGHGKEDPTVDIFFWIMKDLNHRGNCFVWYEWDADLKLGFIEKDLSEQVRYREDLKKLWDGALDERASRRDMMLRTWKYSVQLENAKRKREVAEAGSMTAQGANEAARTIEETMKATHISFTSERNNGFVDSLGGDENVS
jgi:hypothetical protein